MIYMTASEMLWVSPPAHHNFHMILCVSAHAIYMQSTYNQWKSFTQARHYCSHSTNYIFHIHFACMNVFTIRVSLLYRIWPKSSPWILKDHLTMCLCDYINFFKLELWPRTIRSKFNFTIYPITFPNENPKEWKKLFKPCASQRLFLPVRLESPLDGCIELLTIALVKRCISAVCFPADPEGGGFFALCGHRYHFSASSGGYLGSPFSLRLKSVSCHGSRTWGGSHRMVQPLCPPPLLWQNRDQLRGHAHEHDTSKGQIF